MCKEKKKNNGAARKKQLPNLGKSRSFPFPSLGIQKKSAAEFHFGTLTCFYTLTMASHHVEQRFESQVANLCNPLLHCRIVGGFIA